MLQIVVAIVKVVVIVIVVVVLLLSIVAVLVVVNGDTEDVIIPLLPSIAGLKEEGDAINNKDDAGGDTINKSSSSSHDTSCSITGWSLCTNDEVVVLCPLVGGTLFERRRLWE